MQKRVLPESRALTAACMQYLLLLPVPLAAGFAAPTHIKVCPCVKHGGPADNLEQRCDAVACRGASMQSLVPHTPLPGP